MQIDTLPQNHPTILRIYRLLKKIDHLRLPPRSRRDVESILVRQVSREIDLALPWQAGHSKNTAAMALRLGQSIGLTTSDLHDLKLAALLHDIGLLLLPHHLIAGRMFLDPMSYIAVQSHPRIGATLLEPFSFLNEASVLIAHHHERWDGSGYPYGIRGNYIPMGARILAIADAYDAIRVPSAAGPAVRNRIALRILKVASGTQFDPHLVETLRLIQESLSAPDCTESVNEDCLDPR